MCLSWSQQPVSISVLSRPSPPCLCPGPPILVTVSPCPYGGLQYPDPLTAWSPVSPFLPSSTNPSDPVSVSWFPMSMSWSHRSCSSSLLTLFLHAPVLVPVSPFTCCLSPLPKPISSHLILPHPWSLFGPLCPIPVPHKCLPRSPMSVVVLPVPVPPYTCPVPVSVPVPRTPVPASP